MVQWLRIHLPVAGDAGSVSGRGTKIPRATGQLGPRALEPPHHNKRVSVPRQRPNAAKILNNKEKITFTSDLTGLQGLGKIKYTKGLTQKLTHASLI